MDPATIVLSCPSCGHSCRTGRETRPGAKMRCPNCHEVSRFFVHGNGAVELRPYEPPAREAEPVAASSLPPRRTHDDEPKSTRTIFTSRRRNRPIGGYMPFEKSRSYLGTLAIWGFLGLGALAIYWYGNSIGQLMGARPRTGEGSGFNLDIEAKRKAMAEKQKRALEQLKKRQAEAQKAEAGKGQSQKDPASD